MVTQGASWLRLGCRTMADCLMFVEARAQLNRGSRRTGLATGKGSAVSSCIKLSSLAFQAFGHCRLFALALAKCRGEVTWFSYR